VHAATDITGFGLLGHASERAEKSGVGLRIAADAVPLLPGTENYAAAGHIAGGLGRNRDFFTAHGGGVRVAADVDPTLHTVLFDPQTSGGLLFAVDPEHAEAFRDAFAAAGLDLWQFGEVVPGAGIDVTP
jgi:selenide,water dikinase